MVENEVTFEEIDEELEYTKEFLRSLYNMGDSTSLSLFDTFKKICTEGYSEVRGNIGSVDSELSNFESSIIDLGIVTGMLAARQGESVGVISITRDDVAVCGNMELANRMLAEYSESYRELADGLSEDYPYVEEVSIESVTPDEYLNSREVENEDVSSLLSSLSSFAEEITQEATMRDPSTAIQRFVSDASIDEVYAYIVAISVVLGLHLELDQKNLYIYRESSSDPVTWRVIGQDNLKNAVGDSNSEQLFDFDIQGQPYL